jgi:PucR family transcriptional regulator, purine catabolism regulatory protein
MSGLPSVRDVLALDSFKVGAPRVVAGVDGLDRLVRWVHSSEVPDIATLLRGGELVLTTGIGLPEDDDGLRAFIATLADVGAAGLVVELGRRYHDSVPRVMVAAAQKRGLPLIELRKPTPFVRITEAVHALIVEEQLAELRATDEIHQRFTELSVEGAEASEVIAQAAALAGVPVVLENLSRQVLAYDTAGERPEPLLDGWEAASRRISSVGRTAYDANAGWLVTMVGARGQDWGRLLLRWPPADSTVDGEPPHRLSILIERAASTLALGRLIRRDAESLERQMHRTLLTALLDHAGPVDEVALRARALGVPLDRRHLLGVVVRHRQVEIESPEDLRDLAEMVSDALREANISGLASPLDDHTVGALLAVRRAADEGATLTSFVTTLRRLDPGQQLIVAAGSMVDSLRDARRSLVEARQIGYAARHDHRDVAVFRLPHVGLAGLLHLLRDEPRLQTFVERELGPLLAYDAKHPTEKMLRTLRVYLDNGRNKSAAAITAHLSRPAFYERLARIGRILDADLDAVEPCLSLHVALLALDAIRDV